MSPNLLGMAKELLGGSAMDQIGGLLGESGTNTQAAVDAGLPTILGSLLGKANEPGGADALFGELDNHDGGILESLGDAISGAGQSNLLRMGAALLPMLLGSKQGGVVSTLTRMLGMGDSKVGTLLSVLGPIVMGMLSKQRAANPGFNAGNLKDMLFAQKDHLADQLPGELRSSLGVGDLFDAPQPAASVAEPEASSGGVARFLPWIIAAVLGYLGWTMLSGSGDKVDPGDTQIPKPAIELPAAAGLSDIKDQLNNTFTDVSGALGNITDVDSAQNAASVLSQASETVDGLNLDALPAPAQTALAPLVAGFVGKAQGALESAYAIPGVQSVLEPIAGPLMAKLSALTGQ
ncbi:MAG: DUF937 domain-containing protein [Pseudomonadales bacterium]